MTTSKKERERLREAMSKSLAASPKRQAEIAQMVKGQLGADDQTIERHGENKNEETNVDDHEEAT